MKYNTPKERLVKLYSQGMSLRAISRKENMSPNTVKKYLMLQGIKVETKDIIHCVKNNDELLVGLYLGVWSGDGTQFYDNGYKIKVCCDKRNYEIMKFFQELILELFDKKTRIATEKKNNRSYVIFNSKFIYNYVYNFLNFNKTKTYSVHLKKPINSYSNRFLKGFLLGLTLTDGYLKQNFHFNTTSEKLAGDVVSILNKFGFSARKYIHDRRKYGWKNLHMISLKKEESNKILSLFNELLEEMGYYKSFSVLKGYEEYGPVVI